MSAARSGSMNRPPKQSMLASLCSRASRAVSSFQQRAARAPGILFAAIDTPIPDPQITHFDAKSQKLVLGFFF